MSLCVMLVDDEPEMLNGMSMALRPSGWKVVCAADAPAALALLQELPSIGVMVTDIGLPGRDGLSLLRDAMAQRADEAEALAVVMITGQSGLAPARAAMRGGAVEFLAKPFRASELLTAVGHAMNLALARRAEAGRAAREREALAAAEARAAGLLAQLGQMMVSAGSGAALWPGAPGHRVEVLAHALLTPLVPVLGYAELIRDFDLPPDEVRRHVTAIAAGALELHSAISRLLDYDTLMTSLPAERTAFDAAELLEGLGAVAAARGVRWEQRCAAGLQIRGDRQLLQQALRELIANAVAATPSGGTVSLTLGRQAERVRLEVADTGAGLPDIVLHGPPLPFRSVEPVLNRGSTRLGLGLAVAAQVAALHGGRLELARRPEGGSVASLVLPP